MRLWGKLTGDLTGTIVNVDEIGRLDVGGALDAALIVPSPMLAANPELFVVQAGSIADDGRILLQSGDITRVTVDGNIERPGSVEVNAASDPTGGTSIATAAGNIDLVAVGGHIRGDIVARRSSATVGGVIESITAGGHIGREYTASSAGDPESSTDLGTSGSPIEGSKLNQPEILCIEAANGIVLVEAASMTCAIEAARAVDGLATPQGSLQGVVTTAGSFKGALGARSLAKLSGSTATTDVLVNIAGDYRGRTLLGFDPGGGAAARDGALEGTFKVGGSVIPITIHETGVVGNLADHPFWLYGSDDELIGQIIVNANDASEDFTGPLVVDGISITADYYTQTPEQLGGGAMGLAPYHLHETGSIPKHNDSASVVLNSAFGSLSNVGVAKPVKVRHYGPVDLPGEGDYDDEFVVELRDIGPSCSWFNMDSMFTIERDTDPAEGGRTLLVLPVDRDHLPPAGIYRVRPTTPLDENDEFTINPLVSKEVDGEPQAVWPDNCSGAAYFAQAYIFYVGMDCDESGVEDGLQIFISSGDDLNEDGFIDACQEEQADCTADFDGNDIVDATDIFTFLDAWFTQNGACTNPPGPCSADFNASGAVDATDIFIFLDAWFGELGTCCLPPEQCL